MPGGAGGDGSSPDKAGTEFDPLVVELGGVLLMDHVVRLCRRLSIRRRASLRLPSAGAYRRLANV